MQFAAAFARPASDLSDLPTRDLRIRLAMLENSRRQNGLQEGVNVSQWSKDRLRRSLAEYEDKNDRDDVPRHRRFLNGIANKFPGFRWSLQRETRTTKQGTFERQWVKYENYPTINGRAVTLYDLFICPSWIFDTPAEIAVIRDNRSRERHDRSERRERLPRHLRFRTLGCC